jgi:MoaA/NifB/PqqE/SkfB family radical SAM enzyme
MSSDVYIKSLALELTQKCQLTCIHCYSESAPHRGHGLMTGPDWRALLDDAAEIGVEQVQFIGGEPTLHPECAALVNYALAAGLRVEVFTNLAHVRPPWWSLFQRPGVSVATSYYSDDAAAHDAVTGQRGSHARTRANIAKAVRLGVRLRAGVVDMGEVGSARADLESLGVERIRVSPVQEIGRARVQRPEAAARLCGHCGQDRVAVNSDGDVTPCVMIRWLRVGNVRDTGLKDVVVNLRAWFVAHREQETCVPGD